jgi:hypothetical protein
MFYKIYKMLFTSKVYHYTFRPMWSSSGVKIFGRGNCCLLLLLMFLNIWKSPRCAYMFELVGCVLSCCELSCVWCPDLLKYFNKNQHVFQTQRIFIIVPSFSFSSHTSSLLRNALCFILRTMKRHKTCVCCDAQYSEEARRPTRAQLSLQPASAGFLAYFPTLETEAICSPESRAVSQLHGAINRKTAVITVINVTNIYYMKFGY